MTPYTEQESQWIVAYWLSEQHQGRATDGAVILPADAWTQLLEPQRGAPAQAGAMTFRLFKADETALNWLRHQP